MILRQFCTARTARALTFSAHAKARPLYAPTMPLRAKITVSNAMAQTIRMNSTDAATTTAAAKSSEEPDDVLFDSVYGVRTILLNRPAKLNALTGSMAGKILPRLLEWQKSDMTNVIIIKGAGPKAFCAGGDVAVLAKQNRLGPEGQKASLEYFALEYKLDNLIAKLKKPYVAFMDGITMGGGVGLSLHGHFRIATERTLFAMPETTIGFFPDVGASFFLPRLDGYLGTYLALTSQRLKGVQTYYAGIATHYIHSSSLEDLQARLAELVFKDYDDLHSRLELINSTIEEFVTGLPKEPFVLSGETREAIDRCFRYNTVDEIIQALEAENTEWATNTIKEIRERSPTSVRATLLEMRYGAQWSINQAFMREYHMARRFMDHDAHPDFVEGVEKQLAKPDESGYKAPPVWSPPTLEDTTDEDALWYLGVDAAAQGLDLIKVEPENDYLHYPHGWIGLPSENGVRLILEAGDAKTVDQLVEKVVEQWDAKVGVREKLADIIARKIKVNEGGFAEWKTA
ncbi:hypothetical protein TWF696_006299 [Orbilia brochopaga]|uniref:3-hydroxyisobutyryl-CoA hydrolase n=1 Tax=Orbilia brochopaga TaxID=3140254 RepID=A0AAV9V294_9PEZI